MESNIKQQFDFQGFLVNLLSRLSEREQDVIKQRYQLTSDLARRSTLKKIGDAYSITRERVRQIERDALLKLQELCEEREFADQLAQISAAVINHLERNGGLIREDRLTENYIKTNYQFDFLNINAFLFVIDNLVDEVKRIDDHDYFYPIWKLGSFDHDRVVQWIKLLEAELAKDGKVIAHNDILKIGEERLIAELRSDIETYLAKHSDLEIASLINAYLDATTRIEKNILNEWGLPEWQNVLPKKLGDKIQLIFVKEEKPLHFREIAERINTAKFDHKNICPATVHNELISNDNYVLIGRGIYALKTWGYRAGTVGDVIEQLLKESGSPMTKDEIYAKVLKERQVNKSTIYLTLINRPDTFGKNDNGQYYLVK